MSSREKIKQQIDSLSEQELEKVSELIASLRGASSGKLRHLKKRDFGGKLDKVNIRDIAYD